MRISDWSSDVCSSDLRTLQGDEGGRRVESADRPAPRRPRPRGAADRAAASPGARGRPRPRVQREIPALHHRRGDPPPRAGQTGEGRMTHPIFARWPAQHTERLQLFSAPTPNGVKVGIMLETTGLSYEPHRIDIMANESHDPAFLSLNPNGKIPAIYDPDGRRGKPLALFESRAILIYLADQQIGSTWCRTRVFQNV